MRACSFTAGIGPVLIAATACGPTNTTRDGGADAASDAGTDAGDPPVEPDLYCPGGPDCPDEGDDVLHAGVAALEITPSLDDTDPITLDVDGDGRFDPGDGDQFEDRDGGQYDAIRKRLLPLADDWRLPAPLHHGLAVPQSQRCEHLAVLRHQPRPHHL